MQITAGSHVGTSLDVEVCIILPMPIRSEQLVVVQDRKGSQGDGDRAETTRIKKGS